MSVLLVEPDEEVGPVVVGLLVSEGDEVGVIEPRASLREGWKALGAHVAGGSADDSDLVERAAQHARSIVLFDAPEEVVAATAEGARLVPGSETARIIYVSRGGVVPEGLRNSGLEHVVLVARKRRRFLSKRYDSEVSTEDVARAVSAADDLAGELRLVVDLAKPEGLARLGL